MAANISKYRKDFPILNQEVYGKPLVYLDNAATTQKPSCVIERIKDYYDTTNSNIHRGVHYLSQLATTKYEDARKTIQTFINADSSNEIIFTSGATESINLVAHSFGSAYLKEGDEIILSEMEHHSNIVPWQLICEEKKAKLRVIPVCDKGDLDITVYKSLINEKTKLVAITHISNALGTINPVKEIIDFAHKHDVPVLLDGAQAVSHLSIDVKELDCDFYCLSGHKVFGPTGIGVLYGKEKLLEKMPPYKGGGEMIETVSFDKTTYNTLPFKFEAGTPNIAGAIGLESALLYVNKIGINNIASYENELLIDATNKLLEIDGMQIIGQAKEKASVISFNIKEHHPYDIGTITDKLGIALRTGHHCAQPLMDRYKIPGTIRASFAFYNTFDDIDRFISAIIRAKKILE